MRRIKAFRLFLFVFSIFLLAPGVMGAGEGSRRFFTEAEQKIVSEEKQRGLLRRKILDEFVYPSTVAVNVFNIGNPRDSMAIEPIDGSGIVYSCSSEYDKILVLTAGHVGVGKTQATVTFHSVGAVSTQVQGRVIFYNISLDYTLLSVPYVPKSCVPPQFGEVKIGDAIFVAGFQVRTNKENIRTSRELVFTSISGEVSSALLQDSNMFISTRTSIGSSGSGVWRSDGAYVGVLTGGATLHSITGPSGRPLVYVINNGGGIFVPISVIHQDIVSRIKTLSQSCDECASAAPLIELAEKNVLKNGNK